MRAEKRFIINNIFEKDISLRDREEKVVMLSIIIGIVLVIIVIYIIYNGFDFVRFCIKDNQVPEEKKCKIKNPETEERVRYVISKAFVEKDKDMFDWYYNKYHDYIYIIEEELSKEREQIVREYDNRIYMNRQQLIELNEKIYFLYKIDKAFSDIWKEKFDDVRRLYAK